MIIIHLASDWLKTIGHETGDTPPDQDPSYKLELYTTLRALETNGMATMDAAGLETVLN